MSEGHKRYQTEPTLVIGKHELSDSAREAIARAAESYPDIPGDLGERPTLVNCPFCDGCGMVMPEKAAEYKREVGQ